MRVKGLIAVLIRLSFTPIVAAVLSDFPVAADQEPVLTGLIRSTGRGSAYFRCPGEGTTFCLHPGEGWARYHLESIHFQSREAILSEGDRRMVLRLGQSAASGPESPVPAPKSKRSAVRVASISPEDEQLRAQVGWAAFENIQRERLTAEQSSVDGNRLPSKMPTGVQNPDSTENGPNEVRGTVTEPESAENLLPKNRVP